MTHDVKVLCVDDETHILNALERVLFEEDYELLSAESAKEGLAILQEEAPVQVVVSDYRMPEMNGVDFLKEVCEKCPETIRIVLSGYADTASVVSAINEGEIYKFIPKPWNDDELRIIISKAIDLYFLQQKNQILSCELDKANRELMAINKRLAGFAETRIPPKQGQINSMEQPVLDSLQVGIIVIDGKGIIIQNNKRLATFLERQETSLTGKTMEEVLPEEMLGFVSRFDPDRYDAEYINLFDRKIKIMGTAIDDIENEAAMVLVLDDVL